MRTTGAALLGLSQGYNDYNIGYQDRQFELAKRAYLLKQADTSTQMQDLSLKTDQLKFDTEQGMYATMAQMMGGGAAPQQAAPMPPQSVPQAAPQPAPQALPATQQAAMPPGINTAGGWSGINQQVAAQQPARDAAALDTKKQELQDLIARAATATTPQQRAAYADAIQYAKADIARSDPGQQVQAVFAQDAQQGTQPVETVKAAGGTPTFPQFQQSSGYLQNRAAFYDKLAQTAMNNPQLAPGIRARVAMGFQQQAFAFRKQALEYDKEAVDLQGKQTDLLAKAWGSIDPATVTQGQYSRVLQLHQGDPAFAAQAQALGLTGDLNQDRPKLGTLTRQALTTVESQGMQVQAANLANQTKGLALKESANHLARYKEGLEDAEGNPIDTSAAQIPSPSGQPTASADTTYLSPAVMAGIDPNKIVFKKLTAGDIAQAAVTFRRTGVMPQALGREGAVQQLIAKEVNRQRDASGMTAEDDLRQQASDKSMANSLPQYDKMYQAVQGNEQTAVLHMGLAQNALANLQNTGITGLNKGINFIKEHAADSADFQRAENSISTFISEYAKVMSNAYGSGESSVAAQSRAASLINTEMGKGRAAAAFDQLKQEMDLKMNALAHTRTRIVQTLYGGKDPGPLPTQPAAPAAAAPGVKFLGFE